MRARRDELQQHGYQIRKLNQAYFALYGSYGDGFAASPANPIPGPAAHPARAQRLARRLRLPGPRDHERSPSYARAGELAAAREPDGFAGVEGQQHAEDQAERAFAIARQGDVAAPELAERLAEQGPRARAAEAWPASARLRAGSSAPVWR